MAKDKKLKVLVVSWALLPYRSGSSFIVEKLAKNFGADEMVLLGEKSAFDKAPTRSSNYPKVHYFNSQISIMGRGARFFTWFRNRLFNQLVKYIKKVVQEENCNYILAVYPDDFYAHAACKVAKELNIPYSSYFHNTFAENTALDQEKAAKIQPEIFETSEHIFVMSDGMKKFYDKKYKLGKFKSLVHTFDSYPDLSNVKQSNSPREKIKLVLFGNFNNSNLEATKRFIETTAATDKYTISVYTAVPKPLLSARGIDVSKIDYKGFIKDDQLINELQKYDILILTHGFEGGYGAVEYQTIFPTRTIPMLLAKKPIFVHSPKGAFLSDFVEQHQFGILVDEPSPDLVLEGLAKIYSDKALGEKLIANALKTADMFYGKNVAKYLKETLSVTH